MRSNHAAPGEPVRRGAPVPEEDRDADPPPPPSSDAFHRPTRPMGADVHVRATLPGEYPDAAREMARRTPLAIGPRAPSPAAEALPAPLEDAPTVAGARIARPTEPMAP